MYIKLLAITHESKKYFLPFYAAKQLIQLSSCIILDGFRGFRFLTDYSCGLLWRDTYIIFIV